MVNWNQDPQYSWIEICLTGPWFRKKEGEETILLGVKKNTRLAIASFSWGVSRVNPQPPKRCYEINSQWKPHIAFLGHSTENSSGCRTSLPPLELRSCLTIWPPLNTVFFLLQKMSWSRQITRMSWMMMRMDGVILSLMMTLVTSIHRIADLDSPRSGKKVSS